MKKYFYLLAIWAVNFVACSDESANKGDSVIVNSSMEVERLVMNISKSFTSYTRGNMVSLFILTIMVECILMIVGILLSL